jgi:uncharacterized repeat protein (TIGR03809 family)
MSPWLSTPLVDQAAQKWRAFAERRRAHFVELYRSGRWKQYYSEERFLACLREAMRESERWATLAPSPKRQSPSEEAFSNAADQRTAA